MHLSRLTAVALALIAATALNGTALGQIADALSEPALKWSPCGDVPDTECAILEVPVDYARPNGAKLRLRLGRAPASDPAKRKGVLLLLPGGPGPGIAEMMGGEERKLQHVADFQRQYDVVTWDPRGIGKSSPIRCDPKAAPKIEMPLDHKPTQAEFDAVARANAAFIRSCAKASGELFWYLSAKYTARDIERIRQALSPNEGLLAYGGSYGSFYGAAYLEAYPQHVKALILDGIVDHTVDFPTFIARNVMGVQDAFERMEQWCAQNTKCALHGKALGVAFDAAIARERKMRTVVPQMLAGAEDPRFGWPMVTQMLAEASSGTESKMLKQIAKALDLSTNEDPTLRLGKDALMRGVFCSDYGPQRDYAKLAVTGDMLAKAAPRFVWKFWNSSPIANASAGIGVCVGWPREAANPPHPLTVRPSRDVMVANPTHDPATPLTNAMSLYVQIPEARVLIADVDGHQSLLLSQCAYETDARFLADPKSVSSVTLCGK
jgi:pimeloyl-ACP methyl ester carboxylesterase